MAAGTDRDFHISVGGSGPRCVLELTGDVDVAVAHQIAELALARLSDGTSELVIDLAGVTFFDSTAIGALVATKNAAVRNDGQLVLRNVPERVAKLFAITGLDDAFSVEK